MLRLKIPDSLNGASLLSAHQWVRGNIVKTNPGVGMTDYTLESPDGTPLSLSDLTSMNKQFDEVLIKHHSTESVLENPRGLAKQPQASEEQSWRDMQLAPGSVNLSGLPTRTSKTSRYPIPVPDYAYPSYARVPLVGNYIPQLLPNDISPDMVNRLAAQQGYFGALNTLTRLVYSVEDDVDFTRPDMAALIQRYANAASEERTFRRNPGRPFFTKELNKHQGLLSPQAAVMGFINEEFELDANADEVDILVQRATLDREYDLGNDELLDEFVNEVVLPYIAVAEANRGMLRALSNNQGILNESLMEGGFLNRLVNEARASTLKGTAKGVLSPKTWGKAIRGDVQRRVGITGNDLFDETVYLKLLDILPLRADQFYHGMDYALVAEPFFAEDIGSLAVDKEFVKHLFSLAAGAPATLVNAQTNSELNFRMSIPGRFLSWLQRGQGAYYLSDSRTAQLGILEEIERGTSPTDALTKYYEELEETTHADIAKLLPKDKVLIVKDSFGFKPTVPPYWPAPVAYAVMDTISENIHEIRKNATSYDAALRVLDADSTTYPKAALNIQFTVEGNRVVLDDREDNDVAYALNDKSYSLNYRNLLRLTNTLKEFSSNPNIHNSFFRETHALTTTDNNRLKGLDEDAHIRPPENWDEHRHLSHSGNQAESKIRLGGGGRKYLYDLVGLAGVGAGAIDVLNPDTPQETYTSTEIAAGSPTNEQLKAIGSQVRAILAGPQTRGSLYTKFKTQNKNGYWHRDTWIKGADLRMGRNKLKDIIHVFEEILFELGEKLSSLPQPYGTGVREHEQMVPFLTLFLDVEERTRQQYQYPMSEKERGFALHLLRETLTRMSDAIGIGSISIPGGPGGGSPISPFSSASLPDEKTIARLVPSGTPEEMREERSEQIKVFAMVVHFSGVLFEDIIEPRFNAGTSYMGDADSIVADYLAMLGDPKRISETYSDLIDDLKNAFVPNGTHGGNSNPGNPPPGDSILDDANYIKLMDAMRATFDKLGLNPNDPRFGIPLFTEAERNEFITGIGGQQVMLGAPHYDAAKHNSINELTFQIDKVKDDMKDNFRATSNLWEKALSLLLKPVEHRSINTYTKWSNLMRGVLDDYMDYQRQSYSTNIMMVKVNALIAQLEMEIRYHDAMVGSPILANLKQFETRCKTLKTELEEQRKALEELFNIVKECSKGRSPTARRRFIEDNFNTYKYRALSPNPVKPVSLLCTMVFGANATFPFRMFDLPTTNVEIMDNGWSGVARGTNHSLKKNVNLVINRLQDLVSFTDPKVADPLAPANLVLLQNAADDIDEFPQANTVRSTMFTDFNN